MNVFFRTKSITRIEVSRRRRQQKYSIKFYITRRRTQGTETSRGVRIDRKEQDIRVNKEYWVENNKGRSSKKSHIRGQDARKIMWCDLSTSTYLVIESPEEFSKYLNKYVHSMTHTDCFLFNFRWRSEIHCEEFTLYYSSVDWVVSLRTSRIYIPTGLRLNTGLSFNSTSS